MKKYRLKKPMVIGIYGLALVAFLGTMFVVEKSFFESELEEPDYDYVSQTIFDKDVPVVNTTPTIIRPYTDTEVKIVKDFYDYQADEEKQKNSIIYYESTYLQNSGVSYGGKEEGFEVVSILDGTVIDVKEDNTLGKIVEVRHANDVVSVYQSLSEVNVKKDDEIKQGTVIGKSGTSNISKDLNNHLHFELIIKGQIVNPENYYDKKVDEL
ncbi:MAG: M23 family metallopeptidase [Firmicutes bacterium]|nr:M23 family metallopeptidase [Bacillota bacterium]